MILAHWPTARHDAADANANNGQTNQFIITLDGSRHLMRFYAASRMATQIIASPVLFVPARPVCKVSAESPARSRVRRVMVRGDRISVHRRHRRQALREFGGLVADEGACCFLNLNASAAVARMTSGQST